MAPGDSKGLFVYRTRGYPQLEPDVAPFTQFAPISGYMGLRSGEVEEPRTWPPSRHEAHGSRPVSGPARAQANNRNDLEERYG
jgi:hypothetical protein